MGRRMTKTERAEDIARRCNMSVDTVNAVLKAERESALESLIKGEKVTLAGRVIITPVLRTRPAYRDGKLVTTRFLSATAKVMQGFLDSLECHDNFQFDANTKSEQQEVEEMLRENKIEVMQLASLE